MKIIRPHNGPRHGALAVLGAAAILVTACASAPPAPAGAAAARSRLTQLQSNPDLGTRAPAAIKEADLAVRAAEAPQHDQQMAAHLVYLADRKVDIAAAQASTELAESQRPALSQQRDKARLDARTQEADRSASQLATAKGALADQTAAAAELQRQLDELNAKKTDRGIVLTLGDVLFTTGQANLNSAGTTNLSKLAAFLNAYPDRSVAIEGHTDSVGADDYNVGLSQRRADSVKNFLTGQGIGTARLTTAGKGESDPVASNESAAGRQQNRRVEVIISNPMTVSK